MKVLDKKDANAAELTSDEVRQDVIQVAQQDYKMTVPQFLKAVDSGKLDRSNYAVRELLVWIETLPDDDPVFVERNGGQCPA